MMKYDMHRMVAMSMSEIIIYGTSFASTMSMEGRGEASRISMVPVSRSLTMAMEVIMQQISKITIPTTPGTKLTSERCCGLYSILEFTRILNC